MQPRRRQWVAGAAGRLAGPAAVALAVVTLAAVALAGGPGPPAVALDLAVGPAFVAAGLSTWARRPTSRTGMLTAAFGLAWAVRLLGPTAGLVTWPDSAVLLGRVLESLHVGVLVQVVATLPTGRAATWPRRAAVAAGYLVAVPGAAAVLLWPQLLVWIPVLVAVVVSGLRAGVVRRRAAQLAVPGAIVAAAGQLAAQVWPAAAAMLLAWPLALLLGLLRSRLDRSAVNDLVAELRSGTPEPGRLRDALAAALHDPALELIRELPVAGSSTTSGSRGVGGSGRTVTRLDRDGRCVGVLLHDAELTAEPELLDAVAAGAAMALDNERLHAEIRRTLDEVEESRARIVRAADAARERVERDLHHGVQQRLDAVTLLLRLAGTQSAEPIPGAVVGVLDEAGAELAAAIAELRELARGIYPVLLTDAGLAPALAALAERAPVPTVLGPVVEQRLPEPVEQAGYFVVAELLDRAGRLDGVHEVRVEATLADRRLRLVVAHDGRDPGPVPGLADRVGALDGELRVRTAAGGGTTVVATVPLDTPPD